MALSKAALKDLLNQIPEFKETDLPTKEDQQAYIAQQLDGTQKMIFRSLTEVEVAKEFALSKKEDYQENAKNKLEEAASSLKAYIPTLHVLQRIATELAE